MSTPDFEHAGRKIEARLATSGFGEVPDVPAMSVVRRFYGAQGGPLNRGDAPSDAAWDPFYAAWMESDAALAARVRAHVAQRSPSP